MQKSCKPLLVKTPHEEAEYQDSIGYPKIVGCDCDSFMCRIRARLRRLFSFL